AYYEARAPEYDDWWLGTGKFVERKRPGWREAVDALVATLARLPPGRTLDVACGTGFLTQHLPGQIVGLDQSETMLEISRGRLPARVHARRSSLREPARVHPGPGARLSGRQRAAALARARRPDPPPLARHGRRRVLRDLLLRVGHALLPRSGSQRQGRSHSDA